MCRISIKICVLLLCMESLSTVAWGAESIGSALANTKYSGYVRVADWIEHNRYQTDVGDNTFCIGGQLKASTGVFYGLSATFGFFTAHSLGLNSKLPYSPNPVPIAPDRAAVNPTLTPNIDVLGLAYLNWERKGFNLRVGNQRLKTPFANSADYRMIPLLYQGAKASYRLPGHGRLVAARIFRYKGWVSSSFDRTNSYIWNGITSPTIGFWLVGGQYGENLGQRFHNNSQLWFYEFYDYGKLGFLNDRISFKAGHRFKPFIGVQAVRETSQGKSILGKVNSTLFGGKIGLVHGGVGGHISIVHIVRHKGAYHDGGLASPYTNFSGSAALFTRQPLYSTEELGAGNAYQGGVHWAVNKKAYLALDYTYFAMGPAPGVKADLSEINGILVYRPSFGSLKGLRIVNIPSIAFSPGARTFLQDRLEIQLNI